MVTHPAQGTWEPGIERLISGPIVGRTAKVVLTGVL